MRSSDRNLTDKGERAKRKGRLVPATPQPAPPASQEQAPLGSAPSYDDVLDMAVEYSFPCSDPIAVHSCCGGISRRGAAGTESPD